MGNLEDFFGVNKEERESIKAKEKRKMLSLPIEKRIGHLKKELKRFETPEWEFIIYVMINNPSVLSHQLNMYSDYEERKNKEAIIRNLTEYCAFKELFLKYRKI